MNKLDLALRRVFYSPYFLVAAAFVCFFIGLGSVPLFDLDEGAFTEATREMLESGVYAATYLDGEPRYDKPILFYWFQAASIKLLGYNEWAFRLPSVFAACLWALAIYSFVKEFFNVQRAQIATVFMISCLWVGLISRSAIADALLNLFLSLTLFDIWRHIQKHNARALLRAYLWMALGTLTKGPVAVVVPVAVSFSYLVFSKELSKHYLAYFNIKGWAIYLAVVCPWLVAVWYTQPGFFEGFLGDHNLSRFTSTRENHGGSLFYYFGALPLILLPISGLLFSSLVRVRKIWQHELKRFLAIWFLVIFAVFSFSQTQLPHYILNCCVPLFILLATTPKLLKDNFWSCFFGLFALGLFVFLPELLAIAAENSDGYDGAVLANYVESISPEYRLVTAIAFLLATIVCFLPKLKTWQRLAVIGITLNVIVFSQVVKVASNLQQRPIHVAIEYLAKNHPEETVVAYRMHMPTFSVYRQKITPLRAPEAGELALVRVDRLDKLRKRISPLVAHELHNYGGLVLVRALYDLDTKQSEPVSE